MKKVIALVLAVAMVLSCGVMAFAANQKCPYCNGEYDETLMSIHMDACAKNPKNIIEPTVAPTSYVCSACSKVFDNMAEYNDHIDSHWHEAEYTWDKYIGTDVVTLISNLVDIFQNTGILDMVKELINKIWSLIENAASQASVAGAVADLEAKVGSLGFGDNATIKELINNLKQKIKALYGMNEKATTVEATEAEAPAETGSASVGIAAFAAISVAAAAAYVCTKKKA